MATATKTPAKRAASQSNASVKFKAGRTGSGVAAKGTAKVAVKSASAKGAKAGLHAPRKTANAHGAAAKRLMNGDDASAGAVALKPSRARAAHAKGNGAM